MVATTNSNPPCWNPNLRKLLGAISSLGLLETAYLTYDKLQYSLHGKSSAIVAALCSAATNAAANGRGGTCNDVLHGPYASRHLGGTGADGLEIPLSALGMGAYAVIFVLAVFPLFYSETSEKHGPPTIVDAGNRIALLAGTTLMASFSMYLISLLLGVLHATCPFCFLSAGLSISLAGLSWLGGALPTADEEHADGSKIASSEILEWKKRGALAGASSAGLATVVALSLFFGVDVPFDGLSAAPASATDGRMLPASDSDAARFEKNVPPPVTTASSPAALALASDLSILDSRMFGEFWCSQ